MKRKLIQLFNRIKLNKEEKEIYNYIKKEHVICSLKIYEIINSLEEKNLIEPVSNYYGVEDNNEYYYVLKGNPRKVAWIEEELGLFKLKAKV